MGTKGLSREGTVRSPSAMSNASTSGVQVRLRQPGLHRKPRPTSIAVSGMSQSMYEKKTASAASTPSSLRGPPRLNTPDSKKKGPGSIGRGGGADDPNDDTKSNASSSSSNKAQVRRTPAQVKAADAKKAKPVKSTKDASLNPPANTPIKKQSVISNNKPNCNATKEPEAQKDERVSDSDEKKSVENLEISKDETKVPKREKRQISLVV